MYHYDSNKEVEECEPLSQSRYILAKYRIQLEDKHLEVVADRSKKNLKEDFPDAEHVHIGPKALEPNLRGGDFGCNKSSFCQFLWCFCVPCYAVNMCWIGCLEMMYDRCSSYITRKEEVSALNCCCLQYCQIA